MKLFLAAAILILIFDQILKFIFYDVLGIGVLNGGIAYGFGAGNSLFFWSIIVLTFFICGLAVFLFLKYKKKTLIVSLGGGLFVGGAIGNLIDRIFLHGVRDFIPFNWIPLEIFDFTCNLADISLTAAVFLLFFHIITETSEPHDERQKTNGGGSSVKKYMSLRVKNEESVGKRITAEDHVNGMDRYGVDIKYEDDDLMVINKPVGLVVHHGAGIFDGTLEDILPDNGLERRGIVHRLDKMTQGLLIVAKNETTLLKLREMFKCHEIKRTYVGLCSGIIRNDLIIDKNIIRNRRNRTLFVTTNGDEGRNAVTILKVLRVVGNDTWCEFELLTGRTHQIRVHCKSIGHPLVGDAEYNPKGKNGQKLQAYKLEFVHPISNKLIKVEIASINS
ncbi:MAG: signal peptidase II [Christensenellaceae bacterium]|jgi:23S rRNA pseudouridine1911/1915/1917 synthase|nr:signal peptidase II [Christensenellaceae bacterium]